jgi:hypothetical protein
MNEFLGLFVAFISLGAPLLGLYIRIRLLRSENGERYIRQQAQGPFVPSGEEKHE